MEVCQRVLIKLDASIAYPARVKLLLVCQGNKFSLEMICNIFIEENLR